MGKNEVGVSLRALANMLYLQKLNSAKRQDKYKEDQTVYLKKKITGLMRNISMFAKGNRGNKWWLQA